MSSMLERFPTDQQTFTRSMEALLHPKRIALVGDSPNPGFASNIHRNLITCGYDGTLLPINPRYEEVDGLTAYPSVDAIPGGADLAIVVVPSRFVEGILAHCEAAGVGAINIITSGFGEQSDNEAHERQAMIRDFAARTGIRIVGPNCLGNISTPGKMVAMSGPYQKIQRGSIGLALQSGLLAYSLVLPPMDRGIGVTYVVTTGNEADLEVSDLIRYYVDDDETKVIGAFIEQVRDPEKFIAVADLAAEKEKPIVLIKIGRSEQARRSAQAHTGSLVGSDEVIDTVMRQHGIVRVNSLEEMTEVLAAFHTPTLPKGTGVGAIYVSGGAAGLVSDLSQDLGIELPELAPQTVERLERVIPEYGTVGNPLDTTGMAGAIPEIMEGALVGMAEDPSIHTIIYGQAYATEVDFASPAGKVMKTIHERYPDKVFFAVSLVPGQIFEARTRDGSTPLEPDLHWGGVPFLQGVENGLRAVAAVNRYAAFQRTRNETTLQTGVASSIAEEARTIVRSSNGKPLVERTAKEVLQLYGLPVTSETLATSANEAVNAAREIGYPVVLKIESPDIVHKTDAGGVLLNVSGDEAVRAGFSQIMENAQAFDPEALLSGVLVQEMVSGGRELILGMTQDREFGPVIAIGLGGIFVEVLKDIALGVPPLCEHDGEAMLQRLRGKAILEGTRGDAAADIPAVLDILSRFSQLCIDLKDDVAEIDINPLLVFDEGDGATVVDCLIIPVSP